MKRSMLMKARKSFLGRALRRLLGEEKGAVMMEYIVIGLLIAAVAVVAIGYFGNGITNVFGILTQVVAAKPTNASTQMTVIKGQADTANTQSATHQGTMHTDTNAGKVDTTLAW